MTGLGFLLVALSAGASGPPPDEWLNYVAYIISSQERKAFQDLSDDDARREFMERFWQRRDPDPSTEYNPVREEHQRRMEFAAKHFGRNTDRARIYVNYGKPQQRLVFSPMNFEVLLLPKKAPTTRLASYPSIPVDSPEAEIWSYWEIKGGGQVEPPIELLFMRVPFGEAGALWTLPHVRANAIEELTLHARRFLNTALFNGSRTAAEDFHLVYAGSPHFAGVRDFYHKILNETHNFDSFELARNLTNLRRPSGDWLDEAEQRSLRLREEVESNVFFGGIKGVVDTWFLQSANGYVCVPFTIYISGPELSGSEELALLAEMRRGGRTVAQFNDVINLKGADGAVLHREGLTYPGRLTVRPGPHELVIHILDRRNGRYGKLVRQVDAPSFQSGLELSDLVLCNRVLTEGQSFAELPFRHDRQWFTFSDRNPLRMDDYLFLPAARQQFRRKDLITVFFEIYDPELKRGNPDIEVTMTLKSRGGTIAATEVSKLHSLTLGATRKISYARSLSIIKLPPGRYRLEVEVTDRLNGNHAVRSRVFEVM